MTQLPRHLHCELRTCKECRKDVWISRGSFDLCRVAGVKPLLICTWCVGWSKAAQEAANR